MALSNRTPATLSLDAIGRTVTWMSSTPRAQGQPGVTRVLAALGGDEVDAVLERVSLPAYVIDAGGRIRYQNERSRAEIGEAVGRPFIEFVASQSAMSARVAFTKQLLGNEDVSEEEIWVRTPGGDILCEVHSVALEAGGRVVGVFGIGAPREALRASRAQLERSRLTPRQLEVLQRLSKGESTAQISAALHIAPDTVRNHVRAILRALGTHSRLEAVVEAHRLGVAA